MQENTQNTTNKLRLAANAVKARLFDASRETKLAISSFLSYEVEGADKSAAFKAKRWDGRSSFFDFVHGTFPAGFVPVVARELRRLNQDVTIIQKPLPAPLGPEIGTHDPMGWGFDPRYEYQPETVRALLRHGRMIAQVATGGGKSRIAILATATVGRPTLFLTTRSALMYQMKKSFEKAGYNPGVIGDGIWAPRKTINVAMVQTLVSRLAEDHPERERTLKFLQHIELVIGEEAHEAGGNGYFDILNLCQNAHYRLALTATPFMRSDAESNMRLMAAFGPIGIQISEKTLIDRGILATPKFRIIEDVESAPLLRRSTRWPSCYDMGIVENASRNKRIVQEIHRANAHGLTALVLVQRKNHGNILLNYLEQVGLKCEFIFGETDQNARQDALNRLASGEIDVLIGSTILDVGVDVPSIGMVVLAGGGKAEVNFRQRIGRGLRAKASGPNVCYFVDFEDKTNRILQEHSLTRENILKNTPGFAENILSGDFDYAIFH